MRLVDADALKEKAYSVTVKNEWHMHESIDVVDVEDVDNMPTIDAVPARNGRWARDMGGVWCSVCGEYSEGKYAYCPNCGAKMDEEER